MSSEGAELGSRLVLVGLFSCAALTAPVFTSRTSTSLDRLPRVMVWAWERPEDFRALELDSAIGVAFLAQTITTSRGELRIEPRRQPLKLGPATPLVAVTRIEATALTSWPLTSADASDMARAIARTATTPRVAGIQIDFDATPSQRDFYRELVTALRRQIAPSVAISATALASWCAGDRWLRGLDVDEIVPALFRMGPTNQGFRTAGVANAWSEPACRHAVGISLDEPVTVHARRRRVYVFSPKPWSGASLARARTLVLP